MWAFFISKNLRFPLPPAQYGCILCYSKTGQREKGTTMTDYEYDTLNAELDAMVSRTMSEYDEAGAKVVYCEHNVLGVTFATAEPSTTSTHMEQSQATRPRPRRLLAANRGSHRPRVPIESPQRTGAFPMPETAVKKITEKSSLF